MMRLFLSPDVIDKAAPVVTDTKVTAEAALKAQNEQAMQKAAADQKAQQDAGAAKIATDKATADAAAQAAAKAVADSKVNQDKAAADAKAKAAADGSTPWDATGAGDKKEPTAEEKAAAEAATAKAKADGEKKFELKAPEGVKLEPAVLEKFGADMKALGLTQDQAQKFLERDLAAQKANEVAVQGQLKANDQRFVQALQSEWGDKFAENSEHVKRGFEDFDPSGKIRAGLKAAGLINWPEAVKAMERHGRRMAEDKLFSPNTGKAQDPKMTPEEKIKAQYARQQAGQK